MAILRVLEKVLIYLIFLFSGLTWEARGEEEIFPLVNGLFKRYLGIRYSYNSKNRISVENYFLINETSANYFEKLIKMKEEELREEARKKIILPDRLSRERMISLLIYPRSSLSRSSIFWEYHSTFPTKYPTEFSRSTGYKKEGQFIIEIYMLGKKTIKSRLLPLKVDKIGRIWSYNDIEEYGETLKIGVISEEQEFTVKINDSAEEKKFKGRKVSLYEIIKPPKMAELSYFWYSPDIGLVECGDKWGRMVLIEYFRPDLKKGWRMKLSKEIIDSLYAFGEKSLNKRIRQEVEKAWEEKGFKVFYLQEWPEENTKNKSKK
ncbi:hypothetical protein J7K43_09050 [Candidatus Calescamantes bacterium]|nr:hypothetical protein [Candidatus Calescamantes bacterium]